MIVPHTSKTGRKTYGVRVYRGKLKGYEWTGTFATLREAREGERAALRAPKRRDGPVCDEFALGWLAGLRVKDSSKITYRSCLNGFVRDFAGVPMGDVGRGEAYEWAVRNRWRVDVARAVFEQARRLQLVDHNPFAGLRLPQSRGRKDKQPLTVADVDRLAGTAGRVHGVDYGHVMRAFVLFTAYSGMRPGEVYALRWGDVDVPAREIHVRRRVFQGAVDIPKSNKTRTIALAPEAQAALRLLPFTGADGLVFRTKLGRMLSSSRMNDNRLDALGRPLGYWSAVEHGFGSPVDIAELRHFCGHYLYVRMGRPARIVAVQLGHATPRLVEERYGHFEVGALDELKDAFGGGDGRETDGLREAAL